MYVPNNDVPTRLNSTFAMIDTAIKMQRSLHLLCEINEPLQKYLISDYEWLLLSKVYTFLRYFKELTEALSREKYVTLPLIVIGFNMLVDRIAASIDASREKADLCLIDESMLQALEVFLAKLMKHYEKGNWVYCAILILDPKHKLKTFYKTSWGREVVAASLTKFETMYKTLYYKL